MKSFEKNQKKKKQRFCPKPFEYLEVQTDGSAWVCCHDWLPTSIGNLSDSNLKEVWNSKTAKDIRQSILDGSFSFCNHKQCPDLVSNSLPTIATKKVKELSDALKYEASSENNLPISMSLTYDPTCNLKCPSCRSDYIVLDKEGRDTAKKIQNAIFESALSSLEKVILTGYGDPFSSSVFREFLRTIKADNYPNLSITLMTNGLLCTPRMWESVSAAHDLIKTIHVSIDACSDGSYQLNRGGKFSALLKNLEFISTLRKKGIIQAFEISFVVQDNNFREMPEFTKLGERLGCDQILFQRIINWGTYKEDDFKVRAVHQKGHPNHDEFLELLSSEVFDVDIVDFSNLSNFRLSKSD